MPLLAAIALLPAAAGAASDPLATTFDPLAATLLDAGGAPDAENEPGARDGSPAAEHGPAPSAPALDPALDAKEITPPAQAAPEALVGLVPAVQPPPVPDLTAALPIEVRRVYILGQEVDPGLDDSVRTTGGEQAARSVENRADKLGSPSQQPKAGPPAPANGTGGADPVAPDIEPYRPPLLQEGMSSDQPLLAWSPVPAPPRMDELAPADARDDPAPPAWSSAAPVPQDHLPTAVVVASVVSGGISLMVLVRWLAPSLSLLTRTPSREGAHPVRLTLLQLVEGNPGILLSTLRQSVRCSAGTIQYHLRVLERQGAIRCVRDRRRCCVFPAGTPDLERDALAALVRGRARDLAQTVLLNPGLQQKQLTGGLAMSRKTARRHLDDLVALGLVHETPDGRSRTYLPSPRLGAILAHA